MSIAIKILHLKALYLIINMYIITFLHVLSYKHHMYVFNLFFTNYKISIEITKLTLCVLHWNNIKFLLHFDKYLNIWFYYFTKIIKTIDAQDFKTSE